VRSLHFRIRPVSSTHVQSVAETILRTAKDGERDPKVLKRMALLELQISPRLEFFSDVSLSLADCPFIEGRPSFRPALKSENDPT
jgi:hypothetical protein